MFKWIAAFMCVTCNLFYACATLHYETPRLDDQFDSFEITEGVPYNGSETESAPTNQPPFTMEGRSYITFTFKGKGNALLHFHEKEDPQNSFTVEIGGDSNHDRIAIYYQKPYNKEPQTLKHVAGITNDTETRWYWIYWNSSSQSVHVGICTNPYEQELLQYSPLDVYDIGHIYLSTSAKNTGLWEFPSDGELFGTCDSELLSCPNGHACDFDFTSRTYGTCITAQGESFPSTGNCPDICNGNVVCPSDAVCRAGECKPAYSNASSVVTETNASTNVNSTSTHLEKTTNTVSFETIEYTISTTATTRTSVAATYSIDTFLSTTSSLPVTNISIHTATPLSIIVGSALPTATTDTPTAGISTIYRNTNTMAKSTTSFISQSTTTSIVPNTTKLKTIMTAYSVSTLQNIASVRSTRNPSKSLVKTTEQGNEPSFFNDIGKLSAVVVSGSVATLGAAGFAIYTYISRCRPSLISPIAVSRAKSQDEEQKAAN